MKELLEKIERPLIEKVLGIKADKVSKLNVVTQLTDEREADFVIKVENRDEPFFIAHAEIQSTNDPPRSLKIRSRECCGTLSISIRCTRS